MRGRALSVGLVLSPLLVAGCPLTTFRVDDAVGGGGVGGSGGSVAGVGGTPLAGRGGSPSAGAAGAAPLPALERDQYAILQGETLTVLPSNGVLANDLPSDLRVVGWKSVGVPEDLEATVTIQPTGEFTFRPSRNFFGIYRVEYTAENTDGESAEGELQIRVVPTEIRLNDVVKGIGGFVLYGAESDAIGVSLDGLADVNEDGMGDFAIGAPGASSSDGAVYVVYGKDDFTPIELQVLPNAMSERRFVTLRGRSKDRAGVSVSGIGSLDDDDRSDLVIGANGANGEIGRAYVVYTGSLKPFEQLPTDDGYTLEGDSANVDVGRVVSGAGDVNGDGFPDVLVSSKNVGYGWIHVVFGNNLMPDEGKARSGPVFAAGGLHLRAGEPGDEFPLAAARAGDIDGDGNGEVLLASHSSFLLLLGGESYPPSTEEPQPDGSLGGWSLLRSGPPAPASAATAGDVDGDGERDVVYCDGVVYCRVVFGPPSTLGTGWSFAGFAPGSTRLVASGGGDVDGDGFSDVLLSDDRNAYVVYGKPTGHSEVNVASLRSIGYPIRAATDGTITALAMLGDVNGDGVSDFAIADASADGGAGRVYVLFGVLSDLDAGYD